LPRNRAFDKEQRLCRNGLVAGAFARLPRLPGPHCCGLCLRAAGSDGAESAGTDICPADLLHGAAGSRRTRHNLLFAARARLGEVMTARNNRERRTRTFPATGLGLLVPPMVWALMFV